MQGNCPSSRQVCLVAISTRGSILTWILRLSEEYGDAHFIKIDVDEVPDVAQELAIRAMPTFMVFKNGEKVAEIVGANPPALKAAVEKYAGAAK
jgi:thioredoxin 1